MAGNEIRPYQFFLEANGKQKELFLITHNMLVAYRPQLHTELTLPQIGRKVYVVVRIDPPANPDNTNNKYFLVDTASKAAPLKFTGMDHLGM